jgi:hypothetical protein
MKKKLPIYYCKCCKKCKHRDRSKMKSLFDDSYVVYCADINGLGIKTIIPNVFYVIDWCKLCRE